MWVFWSRPKLSSGIIIAISNLLQCYLEFVFTTLWIKSNCCVTTINNFRKYCKTIVLTYNVCIISKLWKINYCYKGLRDAVQYCFVAFERHSKIVIFIRVLDFLKHWKLSGIYLLMFSFVTKLHCWMLLR